MVRAQENSGKKTTFSADFTNTDDRRGGRSAHVPPGDYLLEVSDAEVVPIGSGKNAGKSQVAWIFRIVGGVAGIGQVVYYYTTLNSEQKGGLWQLRNLLSDLLDGKEIPKSKANVNLENYYGKRIGAVLMDDEPWEPTNEDGTPKLNPDGSQVVIEKSVISTTYPASRYVGAAPAAAPAEAPAAPVAAVPVPAAAPVPQNGTASPVAVAAAITQPAEDDADIPTLPVAEL